jgi:formate dehydrogenase iron-sulfur subunit
MHELSRRSFLKKGSGATAALAVGAGGADIDEAMAATSGTAEMKRIAAEHSAMLFDYPLCLGCRACELACESDNQLGRSSDEIFAGRDAEDARALDTDVLTYVTRHTNNDDLSTLAFGKVGCMHCIEPACASSCPVAALEKTTEGPVVWHEDRCLGCRYCMIACPFMIPRFEWESRNPRIRKCDMCYDRLQEGRPPACVGACPTGALKFGTRQALLDEAYQRIAQRPRDYVHHVYGEQEAGGTSFLHLAGQPFESLGYRTDLPMRSYREYTRPAMAAIPYVVNCLAVMLGAIAWVVNRKQEIEGREGGER